MTSNQPHSAMKAIRFHAPLAAALAFALLLGAAADGSFDERRLELMRQKEEEIRRMREREEEARRRIESTRREGEIEVQEIRRLVDAAESELHSAAEAAKTLKRDFKYATSEDHKAVARRCTARLNVLERSLSETSRRLGSPHFVVQDVVADIADLKAKAKSVERDASSLESSLSGILEAKQHRRKQIFAAIAIGSSVGFLVLLYALCALISYAKASRRKVVRVSRGPLTTVHKTFGENPPPTA